MSDKAEAMREEKSVGSFKLAMKKRASNKSDAKPSLYHKLAVAGSNLQRRKRKINKIETQKYSKKSRKSAAF